MAKWVSVSSASEYWTSAYNDVMLGCQIISITIGLILRSFWGDRFTDAQVSLPGRFYLSGIPSDTAACQQVTAPREAQGQRTLRQRIVCPSSLVAGRCCCQGANSSGCERDTFYANEDTRLLVDWHREMPGRCENVKTCEIGTGLNRDGRETVKPVGGSLLQSLQHQQYRLTASVKSCPKTRSAPATPSAAHSAMMMMK